MPDSTLGPPVIRFGVFEVDLRLGELRKGGLKVKLQDQPFQILAILLEHPGELVSREQIQKRLWNADTFVDFDHSLATAVKKLREALGDSADNPRFVATVPRRGFRFIAPVEQRHPLIPSPPGSGGGQGAVPGSAGDQREVMAAGPRPLRRRWVAPLSAGGLVALLAVLFGVNVGGLRDRALSAVGARHAGPMPKIESIAVLPLENLSNDPEQDYFADGMTDELITSLGKITALRVISRQSVMRYKHTKETVQEIARELNVDAVVEGAVLRSGDRVRISAQLIHAETERLLWAESYEREMADVLVLQSDLAKSIVNEIRVNVAPREKVSLESARQVKPEAHEAYVKGRYFQDKGTESALNKSIEYFNRAIREDSGYAPAYAGLAGSYSVFGAGGLAPPRKMFPLAKAAVRKALEIDDTLDEAHLWIAFAAAFYDWDWGLADREFKKAIELNPSNRNAHLYYSWYLSSTDRHEESLFEAKTLLQLDPLSEPGLLGYDYAMTRQYDKAIEQHRAALEIDPADVGALQYLGEAYELKGSYEEATAEYRKGSQLDDSLYWISALARVYAKSGRRTEALRVLNHLKEESKRRYAPSADIALVYAALGDTNEAFEGLRKAYQEHEGRLVALKVDPMFDPLRPDPRFQDLLRRMNFPP